MKRRRGLSKNGGGEGVEKRIIVVECFVNYTEECLV